MQSKNEVLLTLKQLAEDKNKELQIGKNVTLGDKVYFTENVNYVEIGEGSDLGNNIVFKFGEIKIGPYVTIGDNVRFGADFRKPFMENFHRKRYEPLSLEIGMGTHIYGNNEIFSSEVSIGNFTRFLEFAVIQGYTKYQSGHNLFCGRYVNLNSVGGLIIGNNVGIGESTTIWTHGYNSDLLEGSKILSKEQVTLGNDCWLAGRVNINPGVSLADKIMVLTEANVTKSFDKQNVAIGGNPAKIILENTPFEKTTPMERHTHLLEKITMFVKKFDSYEKQEIPLGSLFTVTNGDYHGQIILINPDTNNQKFSGHDEKLETIILSPGKFKAKKEVIFNYLTRTHTDFMSNGKTNLLAFQFLWEFNTLLGKFIPEDN